MNGSAQSRLIWWAELSLFLYSVILTISPAVRERSPELDLRWSHWLAFAVWLVLVELVSRASSLRLPDRDQYLWPAAALLSGWGLLTIWRLDEVYGARQMAWLVISVLVFALGLRVSSVLHLLRRYKYLLLTGGLILTALTLLLGTNPGGFGPRLWLGCCGVYFQPSEPLKLLLVIYLAAYLADQLPVRLRALPLLLPTLLVTGVALLLLIVQRDLGTASIFILIFTVVLFLATNHRRVLIGTFIGLVLSGLIGYFFVSVIRIRVDAWLDPWADPSGRSFQIIQSLMAIANGGAIGRGPGLGNPGLVPVAISDFIFSAIAEETGLAGVITLLSLFGVLICRGIIAALRAPDRFRRLLAAGTTAYIGIQSLLIIGGNMRILPLTGVTLPFVSYGGSSLLTSYIALLLIIQVGRGTDQDPAPLPTARPYLILSSLLGLGLLVMAFGATWWALVRGPALLERTDNPRRSIADRYVRRGDLLDQQDTLINSTSGISGDYERQYLYPELGPIVGYTHNVFGQAGLESSLDGYLRGLQGNPSSLIWWDHLLYGTPPPGLDIRLSLQLSRQQQADQLLGARPGAAILMNAQSGEILVMASHPTFDPNQLDESGSALAQDVHAPLLNRAVQGSYNLGTAITPFQGLANPDGLPTDTQLTSLLDRLGLYEAPRLRIPVPPANRAALISDQQVSPLQMVMAVATLSNHGIRPAPRIALAVNTPQEGWVILPALGQPVEVSQAPAADSAAGSLIVAGQSYWEYVGQASQKDSIITWYLGGTLPDWQGTRLAVAVVLEEDNVYLAQQIGRTLLGGAIQP